ncbi:MAG TPA: glucose 1-dehydrogenase [Burkholderiales bacterium]|nr:glucose 1-dehydrogenase [Burkholderiales bacterium]
MPEKNDKRTPRPVALVTGAAQGLGAAIALRLAREGYDLAVTRLHPDRLAEMTAQLDGFGARTLALALDLRSQQSIEETLARAMDEFGTIDLLVNNAAVPLNRFALDVTREECQDVMDVNLTGTFFMSTHYARHVIARKRGGCIVNLASTHGIVALAERAAYGISKAGIIHMTRTLAFEWAAQGIRVNAVAPGTVETSTRTAYYDAHPGTREALLKRVPMGKFATPDEVAGAVVYLAGPDGAFITGHTLLLDGGLTAY